MLSLLRQQLLLSLLWLGACSCSLRGYASRCLAELWLQLCLHAAWQRTTIVIADLL